MLPSRPVRFGEALSRGFGAAKRAPGVVGMAFLAEVGADLLAIGVSATLGGLLLGAVRRSLARSDGVAALVNPEGFAKSLAGQLLQRQTILPIAGAVLVVALLSLALRLVWYTSGAQTFGLSLAGKESPGAMQAASHLHRTLPVAALFLPIYLGVALYNLAAIGSGSVAFLKAMETGSGGFSGALSLALATSLSLLVSFFADALLRLALIRAVTWNVGPLDALAGAAKLFAASVPAIVGVTAAFGALAFIASLVAGAGGAVTMGAGPAAIALMLYARALTGLVGSALMAFLQTAELGAYAAIDAGDRGVLPEPPPPPAAPSEPPAASAKPEETQLVLQADPVLETQLVSPAPPPDKSES